MTTSSCLDYCFPWCRSSSDSQPSQNDTPAQRVVVASEDVAETALRALNRLDQSQQDITGSNNRHSLHQNTEDSPERRLDTSPILINRAHPPTTAPASRLHIDLPGVFGSNSGSDDETGTTASRNRILGNRAQSSGSTTSSKSKSGDSILSERFLMNPHAVTNEHPSNTRHDELTAHNLQRLQQSIIGVNYNHVRAYIYGAPTAQIEA